MNAHEELRALLQRYSRAADDRDIDALAAVFHPEAEIVGARGPQGKEEWLNTMRAPRTFPHSMHVFGDPLIDVHEGEDSARLDTYAVVYQLADQESGGGDLTLGIRYIDDAVVHQGRWVIRHRNASTLWMR